MTAHRSGEHMLTLVRTVSFAFALIAVTGAAMAQSYPVEADQDHRFDDARRHHRHPGALPRRAYHRQDRTGRGHRQPRRRLRQYRDERSVARGARRLHARLRQHRQHHHQSVPVQQAQLRSAQRPHSDRPGRNGAAVPDRECEPHAGDDLAGVPRLREGEHGQGQLRRRRRRHHARPRAERIRAPLGPASSWWCRIAAPARRRRPSSSATCR